MIIVLIVRKVVSQNPVTGTNICNQLINSMILCCRYLEGDALYYPWGSLGSRTDAILWTEKERYCDLICTAEGVWATCKIPSDSRGGVTVLTSDLCGRWKDNIMLLIVSDKQHNDGMMDNFFCSLFGWFYYLFID